LKVQKARRGFTADELERVSTELQSISTFSDENILNNATAQLLTFTNIVGNNFLRTQKVAMDVATVLSEGPEQAATRLKDISIQLGKALNDPKANLSALSRAGIQFSDTQKKTINNLIESNKLYEAQSVILTELERQYGGQAMMAAQTKTGKLLQIANELGDQLEKLGGLVVEMVTPISSLFLTITKAITEFLVPTKNNLQMVTEKSTEQRIEFEKLVNTITRLAGKTKLNKDEHQVYSDTITQLNSKYKTFLGKLISEKDNYNDIAKAINTARLALIEKAKTDAIVATQKDLFNDIAEQESIKIKNQLEIDKLRAELSQGKKSYLDKALTGNAQAQLYKITSLQDGIDDANAVLLEKTEEFKRFQERYGDIIANYSEEVKTDLILPTSGGGGKTDDIRKYYDELERLRIGNIENERRRNIELLDFERKIAKRKVDEEVKNKQLAASLKIQIDKKYEKQILEAGLLKGAQQTDKPNPLDYKETIIENWDLMQDAGDAVFDGLRQSSMQMWDDVFGKANSVLEQIGLRFVQIFTDKALTGIVASLFGEGEKGGNPLKALFGSALDFIPGGGFVKEIFGFADGAIVTKPTMGVFGEAGTEGLIPLHSGKARGILSEAMGAGGSSAGYDFYRLEKIMDNKLDNFTRAMSEKQFRLNGEDLYTSGKLVSRRKNKWEM